MSLPYPREWFAPPGRNAEFQKRRRLTLGASEISAVLGISKYGTALTVWQSKVVGATYDGNEFTHWGQIVEDVVAREFERRLGQRVERIGPCQHPRLPFLRSSPDRAVHALRALVQIKTAHHYAGGWGEPLTDQIPIGYVAQIQAELACAPWAVGTYCVLQRNQTQHTYILPRDERIIQIVERKAGEFWRYVEDKEPPPEQQFTPPKDLEDARARMRAKHLGEIPDRVDTRQGPPPMGVEGCLDRLEGWLYIADGGSGTGLIGRQETTE